MTSGGSLANPKQVKCAIAVPPGAQSVTLVGLYPSAETSTKYDEPLTKRVILLFMLRRNKNCLHPARPPQRVENRLT